MIREEVKTAVVPCHPCGQIFSFVSPCDGFDFVMRPSTPTVEPHSLKENRATAASRRVPPLRCAASADFGFPRIGEDQEDSLLGLNLPLEELAQRWASAVEAVRQF
jgi:hypothetical protein